MSLRHRYFLPDCMIGSAGCSLLKRKTEEARRIENMHPRPAVHSVTDVSRDSLLMSNRDHNM